MDDSNEEIYGKPSHRTQYYATFCATFGALSMGIVLGYSSPSSPMLQAHPNDTDCPLIGDVPLSDQQITWFSSIVNVGSMVGVVVGGLAIRKLGRRGTMVSCLFPFVLSWLLIGLAQNFAMLFIGRVISGMCCGIVTVAIPTYVGEIASPDIRGFLGSGFQLMIVTGVLYAYVFGAFLCWQWLALASVVPAVIFSLTMVLNKESPTFLLIQEKVDEARHSLQHFRGQGHDIEPELRRLQATVTYALHNKATLKDLNKPHIRKPLFISLSLLVLQQFSGVNAILFNLETIFDSADIEMSAATSSITVAVVQILATVAAACLMDRAGRKLLLILSSSAMAASQCVMGIYFYLLSNNNAENLGWLPMLSLMIFIVAFSIGFGPIPWLMMGEIFSADVRELASSTAAFCGGFSAFVVTLAFLPLQNAIHDYGVYWLFSGFCVLALLFSIFFVKETKGKTTEEITEMFGGVPEIRKEGHFEIPG